MSSARTLPREEMSVGRRDLLRLTKASVHEGFDRFVLHDTSTLLGEVLVESVDNGWIRQRFAADDQRQIVDVDQLLSEVDQFVLVRRRGFGNGTELMIEQVQLFEQLEGVDGRVGTLRGNATL